MSAHPSGLPPETIAALLDRAHLVAANAYAPYSRFRVGAAVLLETPALDTIHTGCNVENISFRLTTCAEQAAVAAAIAVHGPGLRIRAVAIANRNHAPCSPCGACRQVLHEFSTPSTWIFFPAEPGTSGDLPLSALLPAAFRFDSQQTPEPNSKDPGTPLA